ncbi:LuxR C-terminal-related transcriptional regulator [Variovorax sp. OV329]|uniref:LuxR C-terminal-related transcriptional regulator n=1 Tax=Variovorax sp. OV329 TaxID=1882825 RepID=UPI0008E4B42A|nr:LuxR C-terminal-related transcriptional regulator [Variovorax sp. OV329]SFN43451.1 LuxR family transcriptional regulator, maltose regulon positive regulatory protein [Variovorax sp. OV329]
MTLEWPGAIASTKVTAPRAARRLVPREGLLARLVGARNQRCVVIQAPAGSGKTSSLVAWLQALVPFDVDVAWLSIAPEDNDLPRFLRCLLASIAEVDVDLVGEASLLVDTDVDEAAVEHCVISLVQAIASRRRSLMLMLDDLHWLDDPRIFQTIQWLLDHAPPQLHLALASRSALPLSLARLRAQGQLSTFDLRDLKFSADESENFLREHLGPIETREARALHEMTDGWVAGLQLYAMDLKGKRGSSRSPVPLSNPRAFAAYCEREVLDQLTPEDLHLLTRMAVCQRFCAPLCAALLVQPHAVPRLMARLTQLDSDNFFIVRIEGRDREAWYRLHPLLREVLLARLAREPAEEVRALHALAWHWFEENGPVDEAVRHALRVNEAKAAADMVEAVVRELLACGELGRLSVLLRQIPSQELRMRGSLRLAQANLQVFARDLRPLSQTIAQIDADSQAGELLLDQLQSYELLLLRACLALHLDDTAALQAMLPAMGRVPDGADDLALAGSSTIQGWAYIHLGRFEQARDVLAAGAAGSARQVLIARSLGALSHMMEGRVVEAERVLREVYDEAAHGGPAFAGVACTAAALLGDVLYELGEVEAACRLLESRIELIERVTIPDAVLRAYVVLAMAHWQQGRRLEAFDALDRLEDFADVRGLDRLHAHALRLRTGWNLQQGKSDAAKAGVARLEALAAEYADTPPPIQSEIEWCAASARVALALQLGDFHAALGTLDAMLGRAEKAGRARAIAQNSLKRAYANWRLGKTERARADLVEALVVGRRLGLVRRLLDAAPEFADLIAALLREDDFDPVRAFYVRQLLDAASAAILAPATVAATEGAEPLKEREVEILELLAQALPNKKIARALGLSTQTIKWHLKNIFTKLGVSSRDEAVARMREVQARKAASPAG